MVGWRRCQLVLVGWPSDGRRLLSLCDAATLGDAFPSRTQQLAVLVRETAQMRHLSRTETASTQKSLQRRPHSVAVLTTSTVVEPADTHEVVVVTAIAVTDSVDLGAIHFLFRTRNPPAWPLRRRLAAAVRLVEAHFSRSGRDFRPVGVEPGKAESLPSSRRKCGGGTTRASALDVPCPNKCSTTRASWLQAAC
jgi:hypothetical protein